MRDLDGAGAMIAAELAGHGLDLGAIDVRESGIERILLVKPAAWAIAMEHQPSVDRETMTPTCAMQIANYLSVHDGIAARVAAMRDAARHGFAKLDALAGGGSEIVLQRVDDLASDSPRVTLAIHADLLGDTLGRERQRITMRGLEATQMMQTLAGKETQRRNMVDDAGSRIDALQICSVAAAAIRADPAAWDQRVRKALGLQGPSDVDGFRDGVWLPRTMLGNTSRVSWRHDTLIVREGMPQTLQSAIVGKPLSVVVEHPWLPDDAVVEWTNQRINEELHIHTAPRMDRMRQTWESLHIEPAAALLELLGVQLT